MKRKKKKNVYKNVEDSIPEDKKQDYVLVYYYTTAQLADKMNEARKSPDRFSLAAVCAFNFIALNASNLNGGVSRPIDIDALEEYLEVSKVRVYQIIGELEAFGFIEPRSKTNRWVYDIPELASVSDIRKKHAIEKQKDRIDEKVYAVLDVLKKDRAKLSSRQKDSLLALFSEPNSFDHICYQIKTIFYRPLSDADREQLNKKLKDIDTNVNNKS